MSRLYSDLQDSGGRRYYFDLGGSPGFISPEPAVLTLFSDEITYPLSVVREPGLATLNFIGITAGPEFKLLPGVATLTPSNSAPDMLTQLLITLSLPSPVESPDNDFVPTILFINTITPGAAALTLLGYEASLNEGGNIRIISPALAALSLDGGVPSRILPPTVGVNAAMLIAGQIPALATERVIEPGLGSLAFTDAALIVDKGFIWLDDEPAPLLAWG